MRKIGFAILALSLLVLSQGARAEWTIHVRSGGAKGGDGSEGKPFATLQEARDAVRAARKSGAIPDGETAVVEIGSGVFRLESTLTFSAEDGGTKEAPVVYRAKETGKARLSGGVALDPKKFTEVTDAAIRERLAESVRDSVRVIDLSELVSEPFPELARSFKNAPAAPWLYVDGQPMTLARWPNQHPAEGDEWARFSKVIDSGKADPDSPDPEKRKSHPGSFVFDGDRPQRWRLDEGVWLFGYWTHDWSYEVIRLAAYDSEKKMLSLAAPHSYGLGGGTWGGKERRFFALNSLDELDAPGEWYLDREKKQLYFLPESELAKSEIVLATLSQPMMEIKGAKHLHFEGLTLSHSHGQGLVVSDAEDIEIAGCTLANLAGSGISISGGARNTVRSCNLYNLGTTGITLNGGERKSLTPSEHRAENNHIHHYGRFQRTYAPGIGAYGCGQIVRHNRIHDAPHNAVLYSGNEHLFEKNEVFRVVMETGDSGAFYTGRDWTSQGNVLRHNYIHHLGEGNEEATNAMGVYLDDCDSGDTVESNVFFRAGRAFLIGGGRDNVVRNNLIVECPIGLHLDSRGMTWKQWNDPNSPGWNLEEKAEKLNYREAPWSERYPNLAKIMSDSPQEPLHNVIRDNVFVDCEQKPFHFDGNVMKLLGKLDVADNLVVSRTGDGGKLAADEIKGTANLAGTSEAPVDLGISVEKGAGLSLEADATKLRKVLPTFQAIPFKEIGLYEDDFRTELP